jgi:hypothetical protein
LLFAQAGLEHDLPTLSFLLSSLGWLAHATTPSFFPLRWGSHKLFLSSLTWNGDPLDLSLPHSLGWQKHTMNYWQKMGSPRLYLAALESNSPALGLLSS